MVMVWRKMLMVAVVDAHAGVCMDVLNRRIVWLRLLFFHFMNPGAKAMFKRAEQTSTVGRALA